jgi:hypothetical protein
MDLWKYINELYEEKRRLDKLIESLEVLHTRQKGHEAPLARRGRKPGMPADERRQVSERMKKYWAERRAGAPCADPAEEKTRSAGAGSSI